MKNTKLAPCPFCRCDKFDDETFKGLYFGGDEYPDFTMHVVCGKCTATGPGGLNEKEATARWNERANG